MHMYWMVSRKDLRFIKHSHECHRLEAYMTGTAQPKMNSIPIVLLLEAKQNSIVAKVDELMALRDELEALLTTTATTRHQLFEATLQDAVFT